MELKSVIYRALMYSAALFLSMTGLPSCNEDDSLDGADKIYIEIQPKDITMSEGDTVFIDAVISNEDGDRFKAAIEWSVDDESVAALAEVAIPNAEDPEEAPTLRWALIGQEGALNKSTFVRATLENGMYGVTSVTIVPRDLEKAVYPLTTVKSSYSRMPNDTVWFTVAPFTLVDQTDIKFEMKMTETLTHDPSGNDDYRNPRIFIDRKLNRVGVVYTAPQLTGKGECSLWLEDGEVTSPRTTIPLYNYPRVWPRFEAYSQSPHPPHDRPPLTMTMDINSTADIRLIVGVDMGSQIDYDNAMAAVEAGYFHWSIYSQLVSAEETYTEERKDGYNGYIAGIKVRSGDGQGETVVSYVTPTESMSCYISVRNLDKAFPVERIVVKQDGAETDHVKFALGQSTKIEVMVEPEASYTYHKPVITVADPSVVEVLPQDRYSGYEHKFDVKKLGTTSMTITSNDKSVTIPITVADYVEGVQWSNQNPTELMVGTQAKIKANVYLAMNEPMKHDVEWTVSDETKLRITPTGTYGEAVIEGLADGEVQIYAKYDGVSSAAYNLVVKPIEDFIVADFAGEDLYVGDEGDGRLYISVGNNSDIFATIPMTQNGVMTGTFSGNNGFVSLAAGFTFNNCPYNLTITDRGNGKLAISGTITLSNGSRVVFNGEEFSQE